MIYRAGVQLREVQPGRRFVINFGSCVHGIAEHIGYPMYYTGLQLLYTFLSEQNWVYHFRVKRSWMQEHDLLVREAHTHTHSCSM